MQLQRTHILEEVGQRARDIEAQMNAAQQPKPRTYDAATDPVALAEHNREALNDIAKSDLLKSPFWA